MSRLCRDIRHGAFGKAHTASRAGQGADFAESFTGFVMDNRYKKITREECRKLFVGSLAV